MTSEIPVDMLRGWYSSNKKDQRLWFKKYIALFVLVFTQISLIIGCFIASSISDKNSMESKIMFYTSSALAITLVGDFIIIVVAKKICGGND